MVYSRNVLTHDADGHVWAVVKEACDLADSDDALLAHAVETIRNAYGEDELREMLAEGTKEIPEPAEGLVPSFDVDVLLKAFRTSLPDPASEGRKPPHLTNYRSETTELVARAALGAVYGFTLPPALHATKGNRNQPILGFDGWAVMGLDTGEAALVLVQVKGTDDGDRPPREAARLVVECGKAITDREKLKGFLMACLVRCKGTGFVGPLMRMLAELQSTDRIENTYLSPVIVRGIVEADLDDLRSLRDAALSYLHAKARGMTLSLGAELAAFGRAAMAKAREHG